MVAGICNIGAITVTFDHSPSTSSRAMFWHLNGSSIILQIGILFWQCCIDFYVYWAISEYMNFQSCTNYVIYFRTKAIGDNRQYGHRPIVSHCELRLPGNASATQFVAREGFDRQSRESHFPAAQLCGDRRF
jgi:hypothetical protein